MSNPPPATVETVLDAMETRAWKAVRREGDAAEWLGAMFNTATADTPLLLNAVRVFLTSHTETSDGLCRCRAPYPCPDRAAFTAALGIRLPPSPPASPIRDTAAIRAAVSELTARITAGTPIEPDILTGLLREGFFLALRTGHPATVVAGNYITLRIPPEAWARVISRVAAALTGSGKYNLVAVRRP